MGKLETWTHRAQIVQAAMATLALVGAAWWFFEQRETYPRADITQNIEALSVDPGLIAIEVNVSVKNTGKRLLQLHYARVRLQEISEKPFDYAKLAELHGSDYWEATRPHEMPDPRQFNAGELRWPVLKVFDGAVDNHVEPGETDTMMFTFLVPCVKTVGNDRRSLKKIRVATDIIKPLQETHLEDQTQSATQHVNTMNVSREAAPVDQKEFAWKARGYADVTEACRR